MNLKTYLKSRRGTGRELAIMLGVPSPLIYQWANEIRRVPAERCPSIEKSTGGEVRCEDLRPDIDWSVLRGTEKKAA